jgi:ubiquinol-cytochrome c reductase subunit 7
MSHQLLPKEEWTKPDEVWRPSQARNNGRLTAPQDTPYLQTMISEIESEMAEREDLESMIVQKRQKNAAQSGH